MAYPDLDIGLLGSFTASVGGASIVPSAAKQRRLLALLAVGRGREIGMAVIAEELWEGCPPAGPSAAVQTYVKQLRQRSPPLSPGSLRLSMPRRYSVAGTAGATGGREVRTGSGVQ